ncbi:MAG: cytochrome c biogenesis protein CcdA [Planctomycetota bacterium]
MSAFRPAAIPTRFLGLLALSLASLLALTTRVEAQENEFGNLFGSGPGAGGQLLTATAKADPNPVNPGSFVEVRITLDIQTGFHVYGSKSNPENGPIIAVSFDDVQGLEPIGEPYIPPGKPHGEGEFQTHWLESGTVLTQVFRVPAEMEAGELLVTGLIDYAACDDSGCKPPAQAAFDVTVTVDPDAYLDNIDWVVRIEPAVARAGEVVNVTVEGLVQNGYHLYGARDPKPADLIPTPDAVPAWPVLGESDKTTGELHEVEGVGTNDWVSGPFRITHRFEIPGGVESGEVQVPVSFNFLLCDETTCLFEEFVPLDTTIQIEPGEPRQQYSREEALKNLEKDDQSGGNQGLLAVLLSGLGAGLIALLMPCTYPMIPITISVFSKRAGSPGGTLGLSMAYGIGIILMFQLIGLVVGPAIIPFAGHWITNAIFALAFIVFGLSLFGLFDIRLPSFVQNVAGSAATTGGFLGVFLMGATLVITSFTCTAPIVGTLLATSSSSYEKIMVGMGGFGLALAVPFVLLSMFPSRAQSMPRAGQWMNSLKYFLAFVEIAAALKFLSNVDLALNYGDARFLPFDVFFFAIAAVFVASTIWAFLPVVKGAGLKTMGNVRLGAGILSVLLIAWSVGAGTHSHKDLVVDAFGPPHGGWFHTLVKDRKIADATDIQEARALVDEAKEIAKDEGKLLLINFTGINCVNCRVVEELMKEGEVKSTLESNFVEARLHTDYAAIRNLMEDMVKGVFNPFYIVVDPQSGDEIGRFQITDSRTIEEDFLAFLNRCIQPS